MTNSPKTRPETLNNPGVLIGIEEMPAYIAFVQQLRQVERPVQRTP